VWLSVEDPQHAEAVVPLEIPDLLLPRRTGFWRVGLVGTCSEDPHLDVDDKVIGTEIDVADYLWAVPAGQQPRVTLSRDRDASQSPERVGPCTSHDDSCDTDRRAQLSWIWPDYLSGAFGGSYSCGAHPDSDYTYAMRSVDDLSLSASISDAIGARAEQRARAAFATAVRKWPGAAPAAMKRCVDDASFDPRSWHIEREPGGWKAEGWSTTSRLCGYGMDFPIVGDLTPVTGRRGDDRAGLVAVKGAIPESTDAHVGPGGKWILATTDKEVLLLKADAPDQPVARVALNKRESVVMVEWATGANAARWTEEARRAHDAGRVAPVIAR